MFINKTYKYKLKLTKTQQSTVDSWSHTCRAIYNLALDTKTYVFKSHKISLSCYDLQKQLTELKREKGYEWIKKTPSQSLYDVIERLDKAYQKFFQGGGFPKFKKKYQYNSMTFKNTNNSLRLDGHNRIIIPKLGNIKYFWSRDIEGEIRRATITKEIDGYYISVLTKQEVDINPAEFNSESQAVGIDVGVRYFLVTSDGEFVDNPRFLKNNQSQMRILQRKLTRQMKNSSGRERTKRKIAKLHLKTKNQRKDFLHKCANDLLRSYDFIIAEKLKVRNMTKSAKGTIENPGKNVKQKSGLNRSMLDLGIGMFFEFLQYKSGWQRKTFSQVPPPYTSQTCSVCSFVDAKNRNREKFLCLKCGHEQNADWNASNNIKREGISHFCKREALACA